MIYKFFLFCFISIPSRIVKIEQPDIDFNNSLNNILSTLTAIGYILPKILKNNEICDVDEDCPLIMRCCEVGKKKYCCSPNNYIKLNLAYQEQNIDQIKSF